MKKRRTPQEKKSLSYLKDTRNDYGENDKASRKAIPFRKALINRTYRKAVNQVMKNLTIISDVEIEKTNNKTKEVRRKNWKKHPDKPLGKYLKDKVKFKEEFN